MPFYVFAEDLVGALIGPFATVTDAQAHIAFCEARGDGAEMCVVADDEVAELGDRVAYRLTPDQDRVPVVQVDYYVS
jgi:hypothetical protein